jgi:splicing factor U2AF subunit
LIDVKEECSKFGFIISLKIPRPMMGLTVPGLGKIFVEYTSVEEAKEAKKVKLKLSNSLVGLLIIKL